MVQLADGAETTAGFNITKYDPILHLLDTWSRPDDRTPAHRAYQDTDPRADLRDTRIRRASAQGALASRKLPQDGRTRMRAKCAVAE